jgi:hypothetical protein
MQYDVGSIYGMTFRSFAGRIIGDGFDNSLNSALPVHHDFLWCNQNRLYI